MALTAEQVEFFEHAVPVFEAEMEQLTEWERKFIADQIRRFREYGYDTHMSPKQWDIVERVWNKLDYVVPADLRSRAY